MSGFTQRLVSFLYLETKNIKKNHSLCFDTRALMQTNESFLFFLLFFLSKDLHFDLFLAVFVP